MARLTVRLPDSLHEELVARAKAEGVSLNQFLVYALAKVATVESVQAQRRQFEALRGAVDASDAEAELQALLASRV
jgi:muconolactone delta-isomerase